MATKKAKTNRPALTEDAVLAYEAELARELPGFDVRYKDESRLNRFIGRLIWLFNRHYQTRYTTVLFGKVYFPSREWRRQQGPAAIYKTLRHEAVHLRDARRFPVIFHLSYLLLLPAGLTVRSVWELRAYRETIRVEAELRGTVSDYLIDHIERAFTGPDYLFMCPFKGPLRRTLERYRSEALADLESAEDQNIA